MATRTIASPRDRLRTIFVLPFMSCSARLPVYALLIGAFFAPFAWYVQGGIMLGLYLLGIVAAFGTAWIWKRQSREAVSSFILELPSYKVPQWSTVLRIMWQNTWAFVSRAGTIIFALSVILWATTYWPRLSEEQADEIRTSMHDEARGQAIVEHPAKGQAISIPTHSYNHDFVAGQDRLKSREEYAREARESQIETSKANADLTPEAEARMNELLDAPVASAQLRHSLAGRFGHAIEPVIRPMGFDWKMGVGLVGAFAAREVFVSTMNIVYAAGGSDDDVQPLRDAMRNDRYADGKPVWRPLVALNMLIWFVLAMQCLSTVAIVKRETGTWRWPLLQLAYMNALAFVVCTLVYQIGRALGA